MNISSKAKKAGEAALGDYVERYSEWDTEDAAGVTLWNAAPHIAAQALRDAAHALCPPGTPVQGGTVMRGRQIAAYELLERADEMEKR